MKYYSQRTAGKDLELDKDLTHGQVRTVDGDWVDTLEARFKENRPDELELTVWKEQGVFSNVPPLCCCWSLLLCDGCNAEWLCAFYSGHFGWNAVLRKDLGITCFVTFCVFTH